MDPNSPHDAQAIVAAYLKLVEAHADADVYPGSLRELPHSKETIRGPFWTSLGGHLSATIVYPAFPWIRAAVSGQPVPHLRFGRRSLYALMLLAILALIPFGAAVAGHEPPGPIRAGGYDRMFLHHMTNHHEVGMYMARLAVERGADPQVRTLATLMVYEQFRENVRMRRWWRSWFGGELPAIPPEQWSTMPGMPTPAQLDALEQLAGADLDRRFLELMIVHHEGAVEMAGRAWRDAEDPRIWILADTIRHPQDQQIDRMREFLRP